MELPKNVIAILLFGSRARADDDELSDTDVLVVVEDRSGKVPEKVVMRYLLPLIDCAPTISWYGRSRLRSMFEDGHLFAWHLYHESLSIWGPRKIHNWLGKPAPYQSAMYDILSFRNVVGGVPAALRKCPGNAIYELGLLYVCARNIAMSASWHLSNQPDFTRYSPFNLASIQFPISRQEYELSMLCRIAGQRGRIGCDSVTAGMVHDMQAALFPWCRQVEKEIRAYVDRTINGT